MPGAETTWELGVAPPRDAAERDPDRNTLEWAPDCPVFGWGMLEILYLADPLAPPTTSCCEEGAAEGAVPNWGHMTDTPTAAP